VNSLGPTLQLQIKQVNKPSTNLSSLFIPKPKLSNTCNKLMFLLLIMERGIIHMQSQKIQ